MTPNIPAPNQRLTVKTILPSTVMDFQCIMGACEDNCCRNTTWTISVDPDSYKKYEGLGNEVGQRILDCIDGDASGYRFKEFDDGKCPLMLDSGLCYIHKELGADFLCKTCATYPRYIFKFDKNLEHWLSLSCPEVVRHVLYRTRGISFVEGTMQISHIPETKPEDANKIMVRDTLAKIISFRKLGLKEKLLYMGMFMRSMSKLPKDSKTYSRDARQTIKNYSNGLKDARKTLSEVIKKLDEKGIQNRESILLPISILTSHAAIPPKKHPEGIENEKYYTLMKSFYDDIKVGKVREFLLDAYDGLIVPYVNSKPYVFENYLMYALMSSMFLSDSDDYALCYAGFAGEFVTMLVFACMFHEYDTFGDEEMVVAMYLFHRRISHNIQLRKQLAERFSDNLLVFLISALGGIK